MYFVHYRSYADIGIHEQMISDEVRTQAYRLFILHSYTCNMYKCNCA